MGKVRSRYEDIFKMFPLNKLPIVTGSAFNFFLFSLFNLEVTSGNFLHSKCYILNYFQYERSNF